MKRTRRRFTPVGYCSCRTPDAKQSSQSRIWNRAGNEATITIFDEIGQSDFGGVSSKNVANALDAMGDIDTITVRLNSPGGDVFEGLAVHSLLAKHPAKIVVEIDGIAASIASFILTAADEVRIAESGMVMLHNAWAVSVGNATEHAEKSALLAKVDGVLAKQYSNHTGQPLERIRHWMSEETWLDSNEAIVHGFADSLIATPDALQASTRNYTRNRSRLAQTQATPEQISVRLRMLELDADEYEYSRS